ncbi:MAG: hypothetical protein K2K64_09920 [Muribaculaceae bacterium]|nr:hypothetical protein [Muribaculaceae bacterium]
MKKLFIKSSILALAAPFLFASCSSDSNEPTPDNNDFEGVVLSLPKLNTATRATTTSAEMGLESVAIIAYESNTLNTPYRVVTLNETELNAVSTNSASDKYTKVPVALPAGKSYKIYVVANMTGYTVDKGKTWTSMSETVLRDAKITGLTRVNASSLSGTDRKYLPMTCANEAIKTSATGSGIGLNGTISVSSKSATDVYADLTYCLAKVRFTMLNSQVANLTLSSLSLSNYSEKTGLMVPETYGTTSSTKLEDLMTGGAYHEYVAPNSVTDTDLTGAASDQTKKWSWQNTWYVGENLYATDATKTQLGVAFSNNFYDKTITLGVKGTEYTAGLERGKFYDIIGQITGGAMTFDVKVNDWVYHKITMDLEEDEPSNN